VDPVSILVSFLCSLPFAPRSIGLFCYYYFLSKSLRSGRQCETISAQRTTPGWSDGWYLYNRETCWYTLVDIKMASLPLGNIDELALSSSKEPGIDVTQANPWSDHCQSGAKVANDDGNPGIAGKPKTLHTSARATTSPVRGPQADEQKVSRTSCVICRATGWKLMCFHVSHDAIVNKSEAGEQFLRIRRPFPGPTMRECRE